MHDEHAQRCQGSRQGKVRPGRRARGEGGAQRLLRRRPAATGCGCDPITSNLYDAVQAGEVPEAALLASLGCGNPTALAELKPGETVLDLGSGGGIDVLLSAKRVGPTGKAFGLDMTDQMLALAEENKRKSGLTNVQFLKGEIEHIPLPDNSVDVIISNCVINLSGDKDRVLREAFRVLKPGGRFAVSDVVVRGEVPPVIRQSMELWVGCVAGRSGRYRTTWPNSPPPGSRTRRSRSRASTHVDDAREFLAGQGADVDAACAAGRRQVRQRLHPRGETGRPALEQPGPGQRNPARRGVGLLRARLLRQQGVITTGASRRARRHACSPAQAREAPACALDPDPAAAQIPGW